MMNCFTDGPVILVSPVHPVTEGHYVTLRCKHKTDLLLSNVDFYRYEELLQTKSNGEMIISAVSKSDEGFYKCNYSGGESPPSWMAVTCKLLATHFHSFHSRFIAAVGSRYNLQAKKNYSNAAYLFISIAIFIVLLSWCI